ncbi:mechanosensitive ion channel family protein [Phytohabitans suffuscus]|uniref:Mechanosensitive ion channel protein MscS n=1 Tax=Phytohabitans suffuscus TaxID=624315 RepID=A0A6F8YS81_9ACTN|nr:mechanosensitive ion channel domain-containing protein [Phytohabitans suffuscus]BCB88964.1 mechanosensitive ion channel protein MscS [Phytohabitans suffuscus]
MDTPLWAVTVTLGATLFALLLVEVVHRVVRRLGERSVLLRELSDHAYRPLQVAMTVLALESAVRVTGGDFTGRSVVVQLLVLAVIAAFAWLLAALALVVEDVALSRVRTDVPDNLRARKVRTQVRLLRRVTVAAVVVVTFGVMLMTFPHVRAVGASLLASAGIFGVVAALAAQSTLGNIFAGLQLTFSDALRLDDVVVVENEWGRIEELTLTTVVVQIWDDRRLIMPTTYFTTRPFQNWTRTGSAVLGTAEFDLDWSVPVQDMREELRILLEESQLWDGRVCVLQVTDAVGSMVRIRALVSANDAPTLWDLRCLVREHFVGWIRDRQPTSLPRVRAEVGDGANRLAWQWVRPSAAHDVRPSRPGPPMEPDDDARVFGGSPEGEARAADFEGPPERPEPDESRT